MLRLQQKFIGALIHHSILGKCCIQQFGWWPPRRTVSIRTFPKMLDLLGTKKPLNIPAGALRVPPTHSGKMLIVFQYGVCSLLLAKIGRSITEMAGWLQEWELNVTLCKGIVTVSSIPTYPKYKSKEWGRQCCFSRKFFASHLLLLTLLFQRGESHFSFFISPYKTKTMCRGGKITLP